MRQRRNLGLGPGIAYSILGKAVPSPKFAKKRRRNSSESSAAAYEGFHGQPAKEEVIIDQQLHEHKHVWSLGILEEMVIRYQEGTREYDVILSGFGECFLTANEKRTQLFIDGGDQTVKLARFHIPQPYHEFETLGRMVGVAYFTTKKHLGSEGGTADYCHAIENSQWYRDKARGNFSGKLKPSEEGVGPDVIYDTRNKLMSFSGGSYTIPDEGIEY